MKLRKLGLEWGAAFGEAKPLLITSAFFERTQILVWEREGGGLEVEIPLSAQLNIRTSTLADRDRNTGQYVGSPEQVLSIQVNDAFTFVPLPRKL